MIMRKQYVFIPVYFVLFLFLLRQLAYISKLTDLQQIVHVEFNDERRNDKSYIALQTLKR